MPRWKNQPEKPIYVTQPFLPPLEQFLPYLEQRWESKWLTIAGPFHQQLEKKLADYLEIEHLALFANGTLELVTALQALRITAEFITTPSSFVATARILLWNGIKVFADIHPETFNLDPKKIVDRKSIPLWLNYSKRETIRGHYGCFGITGNTWEIASPDMRWLCSGVSA